MIRRLALTASLVLAGSMPGLAQTHPPHTGGNPHGPGHPQVDSATHAALHALMEGTWTGMLLHPQHDSSAVQMSVAHDSLHKLLITMSSAQPNRVGLASGVTVTGDELRWTQVLSGVPCKATAVVSKATAPTPATMNGRMMCEDRE